MAPEQVRGQTADARADIFAFGATLYEMLTGRRAFRGETAMDTLSAILTEEPAPLSSNDGRVPPALALIVHRCLEKTPSARFQTATDLAFALEALSGSNPALSAANVAGDTWWRRRGTWWVGGAALAAGALLGIGIESVPRTPTGTSASGPSSTGPEEPRPTSAPSEPMRGIVILRPPFAQITNGGRQVIAISPDGKSIVFVANRRLWLKRWDQDESEPIEGTESGSLSTPFFSPDGQRLGFFQGGVLNTIPLSGGEPQAVFEAGSPWGASWGDDDQIVYATLEGVFRVPAAGGTPKALVTVTRPESVYGPQMLPDGDHLLMTVSNAGAGRWDDARIVVQALSTGTRKVLPLKGRDARYLASGHLVYVVDRTLYAVAFDAKSIEVHGTPVAMERELTGGAYGAAHYAVSKAGHLVYVPRTLRSQRPADAARAELDRSGEATVGAQVSGGSLGPALRDRAPGPQDPAYEGRLPPCRSRSHVTVSRRSSARPARSPCWRWWWIRGSLRRKDAVNRSRRRRRSASSTARSTSTRQTSA
jgi:serine/threonine-protein kinase